MKLGPTLKSSFAAFALLLSTTASAYNMSSPVVTPNVYMSSANTQYGASPYYTNLEFKISGAPAGQWVQIYEFYSDNHYTKQLAGAVQADGTLDFNLARKNDSQADYFQHFYLAADCTISVEITPPYYSIYHSPPKKFLVSPCQVFQKQANIVKSNITGTSATISWTTNLPTTSSVILESVSGTYSHYGTGEDTVMRTNHSVTVTGLNPNTKYMLKLQDVDNLKRYMRYDSNPNLTVRDPAIYVTTTSSTAPTPTPTPAPSPTPTPVAAATISDMKATCSTSLRKITITGTLSANMYMQFRNSSGNWVAIGGSPTLEGAFSNSISASSCPSEVRVRDKNRTSYVVRGAVTRVP